jgi:predicted AlkP superfamily phosphohydrolase/phosphomutase
MNVHKRALRFTFLAIVLCLTCRLTLQAYIGPGAGFVFVSSFLLLFLSLVLAILYLVSWPVRALLRALFRQGARARSKTSTRRVIILGLDGFDPKLAERFMAEGKLPYFCHLKQTGAFAELATSYPSISPVAWSSFATGTDASHHNIFDFLTRDPCTYAPMLSSAEIRKASRVLPLGKYQLPLGKPKIQLKRKSKTFWKVLGDHGVFSSVLRVPVTFPPEKFNGVLLSGMCAPDLKGSQGTFTYFTSDGSPNERTTGGTRHHMTRHGPVIRTVLEGPESHLRREHTPIRIPLTIVLNEDSTSARLQISGHNLELRPQEYSPWLRLSFPAGLGTKIYGICRFYLIRLVPECELYVSPIHIDPEHPALPIAHPFLYSVYLAKLNGLYGTLGLAEDTWALNEGILDEAAFLKQAYLFFEEREKMFLSALQKTPSGLTACVFDTPDRIQHMFFRCLDACHPANRGKEFTKYQTVIEEMYLRMDELVGRVLEESDERTVIMVISDHGFTQFKRGVNLNSWFSQHGYLSLRSGCIRSGDWFEAVDWDKTKAFALGLTGIFINRRGRESRGIVSEGDELQSLKKELITELTGLKDEATGRTAILEVIDTQQSFRGPYRDNAPDLLVGYNHGYRSSWACATGSVTEMVFEDNTRHWSGDHCVAPQLVPGVLFVNRRIDVADPSITDVAPTVLHLFGVPTPHYMQGRPLIH